MARGRDPAHLATGTFLQLEGYESGRYLRWLVGKVQRFVLVRALIFVGVAFLTALVLSFFGQDTPVIYLLIWGAGGVIAVWPETTKEIKQKFNLTQRAMRLLITAFALATIILIGTELTLDRAFGTDNRSE
ncbi:MAG: hypothetical protein K8S97_04430, partial [Anaerolineae bacterium]|nr:hypothetical protein [Anaerolineae bacterium]